MKKRILFVDDENLVLQGLQRMLHPLRAEWEMEFVESGTAALQRLNERAFDVVVSDMRMPGMNGAELLNEVMVRHPKMVRLILSGQADRNLILKCVGSTHQFLSKPCEPELLRSTVARATSLDFKLSNDRVRTLISRIDRLPSLPSVYVELTRLLANEDATMQQIGQVFSRDIGMTAEVLKLANSAYFGLRREISSPEEAASYLGVEILRSLSLALNFFAQFEPVNVPGFCPAELWHHSMAVASGAKRLAAIASTDKTMINQSFTAGVLHDAGQLLLVFNFPSDYREVLNLMRLNRLNVVEAEHRIFGATHVEVGGHLLGLWGLPVPIVEAISLHHQPGHCAERRLGPLATVHVANALLSQTTSNTPGPDAFPLDEQYLREAGAMKFLPAWKTELEAHPSSPNT